MKNTGILSIRINSECMGQAKKLDIWKHIIYGFAVQIKCEEKRDKMVTFSISLIPLCTEDDKTFEWRFIWLSLKQARDIIDWTSQYCITEISITCHRQIPQHHKGPMIPYLKEFV